MQNAHLAVLLVLVSPFCSSNGWAQVHKSKAAHDQHALALTPENKGQHLHASVGQIIQVDLQALSPAGYEAPQVSGTSIQYRNSVLLWPVNPGGPLPIYIFQAVSPGEARIQFPRNGGPGFDVTIEVRPASGKGSNPAILDQANTAQWRQAWTNLFNRVQQTFTPSLPILTGVEVELVVGNPGSPAEAISMTLLDPNGQVILLAEKEVPADDCGHVLFLLPDGFGVSPAKPYSIQLSGDGSGLLGWKYVVGGYDRGDASFNGKPLLQQARSTFLFRTFGLK